MQAASPFHSPSVADEKLVREDSALDGAEADALGRLSGADLPEDGGEADEAVATVRELYLSLFGRDADAEAERAYADPLRSGDLTVRDVVRALVTSGEFSQRRLTPDREGAERLTADAVRAVLMRDAKQDEMELLSGALVDGLPITDVVRGLLATRDFGERAVRHQSVARNIANEIITGLMKRGAGEEAIHAYGGALQAGRSPSELIGELVGSVEFGRRMGYLGSGPDFRQLAQLAEGLILKHINTSGGSISLPSLGIGDDQTIPPEVMRSMLHTLAMFSAEGACVSG